MTKLVRFAPLHFFGFDKMDTYHQINSNLENNDTSKIKNAYQLFKIYFEINVENENKIKEWLSKNCGDLHLIFWERSRKAKIEFYNEEDALAFKLKWL